VTEVASRALNAVWYQKWFVHLRHRPESGGGIAHLIATGQGGVIQGKFSSNVMNSNELQISLNKRRQVSPLAGITIPKFFFDGNFVLPSPPVPTGDGLALGSYRGEDAGQLTVNGELNKLAHNDLSDTAFCLASIGAATAIRRRCWARRWRSASFGQGADVQREVHRALHQAGWHDGDDFQPVAKSLIEAQKLECPILRVLCDG
jgi:hypothetical protein